MRHIDKKLFICQCVIKLIVNSAKKIPGSPPAWAPLKKVQFSPLQTTKSQVNLYFNVVLYFCLDYLSRLDTRRIEPPSHIRDDFSKLGTTGINTPKRCLSMTTSAIPSRPSSPNGEIPAPDSIVTGSTVLAAALQKKNARNKRRSINFPSTPGPTSTPGPMLTPSTSVIEEESSTPAPTGLCFYRKCLIFANFNL